MRISDWSSDVCSSDLAYRSGERLTDERLGKCHDYTRKSDIEHREIMAPDRTPDWMLDRSRLWNGVEAVEKRKDAQLAREVEISLPRELGADDRRALVARSEERRAGKEYVSTWRFWM